VIGPGAPVRRWARLAQRMPEFLWGPLMAGGVLLLLGWAGRAVGLPLLFASLGPTLFLLVVQPAEATTRFYNTVVGHLAGMGAAMLAVIVTGAGHAPPMSVDQPLAGARVAAAAIALALTLAAQIGLKAAHAPAAATTLLFALGTLPVNSRAAALLMSAVALVAVVGEGLRRARRGPPPEGPLPRTPGEV
jgi:hypothetical protein